MDKETLTKMSMDERIAYFNERLGNDENFDAILKDIGMEKKEVGQSEPYGLGLIKIGKEVRPKPGRGDNGFAW